jgi:adenosine deaminase
VVGGRISALTVLGDALDALSKVELHSHIEGAMRPRTLVDLARGNSIPLPSASASSKPGGDG